MANKGTYSAYQKLTPITEDFGQLAKDDKARFDKNRAEEKQDAKDAQAEKDKIKYNPLEDIFTGVEGLDDALFKGIRSMNDIRFQDFQKARNNPEYAKSDEYLAKNANRQNYAKNLKTFTESYSKFAKSVTNMGSDLSNWNADLMAEVNGFFNEEKVKFGENKFGEPIAMVAQIHPETGEVMRNEDGSEKYTETSLAKVLKGTGMYEIVPKVDIIAKVKGVGDILGEDIEEKRDGRTITETQTWEARKENARELVKSTLGSYKNPTALAKRLWADEMGNSRAGWSEEAYKLVEEEMLKKVEATYKEKLKIRHNYSSENTPGPTISKTILPAVTPNSDTGEPVYSKIPNQKNLKGYPVSFGTGLELVNTPSKKEKLTNVWFTDDGRIFKSSTVSTRKKTGEGSEEKSESETLLSFFDKANWDTEENVTVLISDKEFTNIAKHKSVQGENGRKFQNGKELKDYLKRQWEGMQPNASGFNDSPDNTGDTGTAADFE